MAAQTSICSERACVPPETVTCTEIAEEPKIDPAPGALLGGRAGSPQVRRARRGVSVQRQTQRRARRACGPTGASGDGWAARSAAVFEAPAVVAGLEDVAVMRQAIEQGGGHLGVAEYGWPFGEGQVGGDDDGGALIQAADQMKQ